MFPLLTFWLCFECLVHIERCPLSSLRWSPQVSTHFYDVLPSFVKQKAPIANVSNTKAFKPAETCVVNVTLSP
jgi:hypothetical protein